MKTTLKKLISAKQSLQELAQLEMPTKTAYWTARLLDKVDSELSTYEKKKQELIDKHAEKDKDGKIKQEGKGWEELNTKHQELLELEVDIDAKPIDISQVNIDIKPSTLMSLEDFIKFEDNKKK